MSPNPQIIEKNSDFIIFNWRMQRILKYVFPENLEECSAYLFLRGPMVSGQKGDPDLILESIFPDGMDIPVVVAPKQVHGTVVLEAAESFSLPLRPEGDGVIIKKSSVRGSLRFADCFPVVIAFKDPEPGVIILHSGYKGTLKNIAGKSVGHLRETVGNAFVENCHAIIGPGIGPCCYSRNLEDPLTAEGQETFGRDYWEQAEDCVFFDIGGIIKQQLLDVGLEVSKVSIISHCPSCMNDTFYSFRKGDKKDRMFLVAGIKDSSCQKDSLWWENVL